MPCQTLQEYKASQNLQGCLKNHCKARKDALNKPPKTCKDALVDPAKHSTMLYKAAVDR